jgi:CheY-like chemotaxis protein
MLTGVNVLIVDDEPELREVLREYLEDNGFRVLEAGSGEIALAILEIERVNIVISDLIMPGMGGLNLLDRIRAKYGDLFPVIICSAKLRPNELEVKLKGAAHKICKPFDEASFIASFSKILNEI